MITKVFLFFPESDDAVLKIVENFSVFENAIESTLKLIKSIRTIDKYELWYDHENISTFLTTTKKFIHGQYWAKRDNQLRFQLGSKCQDICLINSKKHFQYFIWRLNDLSLKVAPRILGALIEKHHSSPDETVRCLLLNIINSLEADRHFICLLKDAHKVIGLPQMFHIDYVSDHHEFEIWQKTNNKVEFNIRDLSRFIATNYIWEKQKIYREIETGNYWYFDNYHKDNRVHYEVFDSTGKVHLGEANENGCIDYSKADGSKKIDYLFN